MKPLVPSDRVLTADQEADQLYAIAKADVHQHIAAAVAHWRRVRQLTQVGLAERSGLSARTIRRVERRQTPLRIDTLAALADALGVPVKRLVEGRR